MAEEKISWQASASPNIALIKYMGKTDAQRNLPSNASLSYTLPHLQTTVQLTKIKRAEDIWDERCNFSQQEQQRFLHHLQFLKQRFQYQGCFKIYSGNNFPAGCGLASSASSFAALTKCAVDAFGVTLTPEQMAVLSRKGSGSSCRSFFQPWALWREESIEQADLPYGDLIHHVVVVSRAKKIISSSVAHQRVQSSALFMGRAARAEQNLQELITSLRAQDWKESYKIVWREFWDMHALFETCSESFGYLLPESIDVLQQLRAYWQKHNDGPLITMDAGPNVHLLFRQDQAAQAAEVSKIFAEKYLVLA